MIFARFPDAQQVDSDSTAVPECAGCGEGWAVGTPGDTIPTWADSLLYPTLAEGLDVPGSLTHFFYEMSGGRHVLIGDVWDSVITTDSTLAEYYATGTPDYDTLLERVNRDVLLKADAQGVNFRNYNADSASPDTTVDYVFICYQSARRYEGSPPNGEYQSFENIPGGGPAAAVSHILDANTDLEVDGVTIKPESGATLWNITANAGGLHDVRHRWQQMAVMAHEYGHDLSLIAGLGGLHQRAASRYALMQGYSAPAAMQMSALLRYKLGWLGDGVSGPAVIEFPTDSADLPLDTTITLSASYRDGKGSVAIIETAESDPGNEQYFIAEARSDGLSGDTYNDVHPDSNCCVPTKTVGRGLLISHVASSGGDGWGSDDTAPELSVETATGMFDVTTGAPDPIDGYDLIHFDPYAGGPGVPGVISIGNNTGQFHDLFGNPYGNFSPSASNTFGPYTNP
ncbi:hypothetical protein K8I85_14675, partial [bacterium]|nr:hypothetical protein [bacterium]